jgi:hypothetical protein
MLRILNGTTLFDMKDNIDTLKSMIKTLKKIKKECKLSKQYSDGLDIDVKYKGDDLTLRIKEGWVQSV